MSMHKYDSTRSHPVWRFGEYELDVSDRQLWQDGVRVDLNARYLDALTLLVSEAGRLVAKDRFFDEIWGDVVVSDSALSQCIKDIRRVLADDASSPRFIQTVPGHGYRFIAEVEAGPPFTQDPDPGLASVPDPGPGLAGVPAWKRASGIWLASLLGGSAAGLCGGLLYGFGLGSSSDGAGTLSTLLVLLLLNVLVGLAGGAGVGLGLALADWLGRSLSTIRVTLTVALAAMGGFVVGATANMLGIDAFHLFFGQAPPEITGGMEGAVLGGSVALGSILGARFGRRQRSGIPWPRTWGAGLAGAAAGFLIPLTGGHLMGGSLALLAASFDGGRLQPNQFDALVGNLAFSPTTEAILGGFEGFVFGACLITATSLAQAWYDGPQTS